MSDRSTTNAFEFVIVAGARARQLLRGATPRTTLGPVQGGGTENSRAPGSGKIAQLAQREVREGKVRRVGVEAEQGVWRS